MTLYDKSAHIEDLNGSLVALKATIEIQSALRRTTRAESH